DVRGASLRKGHPAPFPTVLAHRLISLFSFAGDTVLDPFAGTGSTAVAAVGAGRNSISVEIEPTYVTLAQQNIMKEIDQLRFCGAVKVELLTPPKKPKKISAPTKRKRGRAA